MNIIVKNVPFVLFVFREYSQINYGFGAYESLEEYNSSYEILEIDDLIEKISTYESNPKEDWHLDFEYKIYTNEYLPVNFQESINKLAYQKIYIRTEKERKEKEEKELKEREANIKRDLKELERLKIKLGIT
jgi:hypothetical protein